MVIRVNTIYVNYMTRTFGNLTRNEFAAGRSGKSMANAILEAAKHAQGTDNSEGARRNGAQDSAEPETENAWETTTQGTANPNVVNGSLNTGARNNLPQSVGLPETAPLDRSIIEAMTMEEYKEYIRERILALPMHSSHMQDTITVTISDEGFAAMKRDADYEEWVLNDLRTGWAWENPWVRYLGGAYSVIHYGATKEECHAEMWNAGFRHGNGKSMLENMSGDEDKDDRKRKSEIVIKPDGTRYLVISEVIGGMKVVVMNVKLTDPDELMQNTQDLSNSAAAEVLAKGGIMSEE